MNAPVVVPNGPPAAGKSTIATRGPWRAYLGMGARRVIFDDVEAAITQIDARLTPRTPPPLPSP